MALGACLALTALAGATPALAEGTPWWHLNATAAPTFLPRGGTGREAEGQIVLSAINVGDGSIDAGGEPVVLSDVLPAGAEPLAAEPVENSASCPPPSGQEVACTFAGTLHPAEIVSVDITVRMHVREPAPSSLPNVASVSGGGTPPPACGAPAQQTASGCTLTRPLQLQRSPGEVTPFGIESYEMTPESAGGEGEGPAAALDTQAGSHPFQLTTTLDLNQTLDEYTFTKGEEHEGLFPSAPALANTLRFKLPSGLIANTTAMPRCTDIQFSTVRENTPANECPADTAIGFVDVFANIPPTPSYHQGYYDEPLFNLTPDAGEPARFGFWVSGLRVPVVLNTGVLAGGDYAAEVSVVNTDEAAELLSSQVTVWGTPGDPRHDSARGWECLDHLFACTPEQQAHPAAFLTLPTACEPLRSSVSGESWPTGEPGNDGEQLAPQNTSFESAGPLTECESLEFHPSLTVEPESHSASTPTGLNVGVEMPQPGLLTPEGRAEAALKATTVRLPPGLTLNPSAANALEACAANEFGFLDVFGHPFGEEGVSEVQQTSDETFESPFSTGGSTCPDAAKVGTVSIQTPLLPHELSGSVYLAAQNTSPFKSPLALYLLAEDPELGVRVKLAGAVQIESNGQVISTFQNTPQVPFTSLHIHLFGGEKASQSTPPACGPATTTSEFVPWSGGPAATPSSTFQVNSGVGGGACPPSPLPFGPSFKAGPTSPQAGAFSPDVVDIGRPDGQQALSGLSVTLPPGFAAILASVTPCPEPAAGQEWSCGEVSHIGEAKEYSGLGGEPVQLTGQAYLTAGYDGAPFGLLVRTLAQAGPFNLGWVNVRSRINVNPNTAVVTVTADAGPRGEGIPTMLDGVPVQLKALEVAVNRPDFTFNPTNCNGMEVTATLNGSEGAAFGVSDPFKAEGCAALPFHPTLTASVGGKASKLDGASLDVKVTSQGLGVANIAKTKLTFPITLPSRLTTIQKACVDSVFESTTADPGSACDEGSLIGEGIAHTPVLKSPLRGPAYLVSHGNEAFPDVEFVLKGEGILVVLDGKTDIKHGITTSEFNAVPDTPVTSFDAILPVGPHSALTANVPEKDHFSLCGQTLSMPTTITAQNGAVIEQTTHIAITGCSKPLTLAQQLTKALKKCQTTHKHSASTRAACERKAHATYTAKAMAACRKADAHSSKKRKLCEADARKAYVREATRKAKH